MDDMKKAMDLLAKALHEELHRLEPGPLPYEWESVPERAKEAYRILAVDMLAHDDPVQDLSAVLYD